MPSVHDVIVHCQKQIKKEPPEEKLMHYLSRLDRLRVTVQDLMETGIGRTINQLSRHNGDVGHVARRLVRKWKAMVSDENSDSDEDSQSSSSSSGEEENEDEGCESHVSPPQEEVVVPTKEILDIKPDIKSIMMEAVNGHQNHHSSNERSSKTYNSLNNTHYKDEERSTHKNYKEQNDRHRERHKDSKDKDKRKEERRKRYEKEEEKIHSDDMSQDLSICESPVAVDVKPSLPLLDIPINNGHKKSSSSNKSHHYEPPHNISPKPNEENERSSKKSKDHHHDKHRHKNDRHENGKQRRSKEKEDRKKSEKDESRHDRKRKGDDRESKDKNVSKSYPSPEHKKIKLENDGKKHKEKSSSSGSKSKKPDLPDIKIEEEIDSTRGVKFEELLGCLDTINTSKKRKEKHREKQSVEVSQTLSSSSRKSKEDVRKSEKRKDLEKSYDDKKKKHLESIIAPTLNISPNYKPSATAALLSRHVVASPQKLPGGSLAILNGCDTGNYWEENQFTINHASNQGNAEDALASMMSSRNQRTKVFSGSKLAVKGTVPRLFDLCMQVIQENIQDLGYTGGVPYDILKPALERATANQLLQIEECNPYLIGETDDLWRFHCNREFRGRDRQELESWRELYERCTFERDEKFAIVRKRMLKKGEVAEPVRKAKLAYVEPVGGPRFNRQKAATIKNGMRSLKIKEEKGPKKGVGTSASVGFNNPTDSSRIVEEHAVLINPDSRTSHSAAPSASRGESVQKFKPRRAPLMAKTMKFIKTLQRR